MKRILPSLLFIILFSCFITPLYAQNLSAYTNIRNEFYVFEDSFTHQLDYLPPLNYKIGGNSVAYVDNKGTFRIYQYGSISTPINGVVGDYDVTKDLILVRTASLYAFDQGRLNLLTRFIGPYVLGDSIVGFIDFASRNLFAYYNGTVTMLKQGTTDPAAAFITAGANLFVYKTYDNEFTIFYHGSTYVQSTEFPLQVKAGNNVVAYTDQYEPGLHIFYKGETRIIEEFNPRDFFVGNDLVVYVTYDGDFKIFWNGSVYNMGNYNLSKLVVKDNLVLYSDRLNYLFVFYNGKSYKLENYIPEQINASQSTVYYYDQSNQLKIFSEGILKDLPLETYLTISNDYDVVKLRLQVNQYKFVSRGKVY